MIGIYPSIQEPLPTPVLRFVVSVGLLHQRYPTLLNTAVLFAEKRDGKHQIWLAADEGEAKLVYNRTDVFYRSIAGHGIAKLKVSCIIFTVSIVFSSSNRSMRYILEPLWYHMNSSVQCLQHLVLQHSTASRNFP